MASDVQICNIALMQIGVTKPIADLATESTVAAVTANAVYAIRRDEVLTAVQPGFARTVAALALVSEDPTEELGYAYRYPDDCLAIRKIQSGVRRIDPRDTRVPYQLSSDATGRLIYADLAEAIVEYTRRITNAEWFPPSFLSALAWRLSIDLATALGGALGSQWRDRSEMYYREALTAAKADAINEEAPDDAPESEFIRARE